MGNKIAFLFGAGAEHEAFNIPSGSEYTLRTMQQKHENLYTVLREFYKTRIGESYVKEYKSEFLFKKSSHTFREILYRAALRCIEFEKDYKDSEDFVKIVKDLEDENKGEKDKERVKKLRDKIKGEAENAYQVIIENGSVKSNQTYETLKKNISFYGAVEKDFSAIVAPEDVGLTQFWRVINYFWSAFFAILLPSCKNFSWYKENQCDKKELYKYALNNLNTVIEELYSKYDYDSVDNSKNYYKQISQKFGKCTAITTNYTPFLEHYFGEKSIYLAGRLSEFEFPTENAVKDIRTENIKEKEFVFPFLMTQAPVKPIVSPGQIKEYAEAVAMLKEADTLVIIGYSLPKEDTHILAILREFALQEGKNVIWCWHKRNDEENKDTGKKANDDESERKKVIERLKLVGIDDKVTIQVVENDGDAEKLVECLVNRFVNKELTYV